MPLLEGWVGLLSPSLSLLLTLLTLLSPILSLLLTLLLCSRGEVVFNRGRHALITLLLWLLVFKVINLNKLPFSSWHCLHLMRLRDDHKFDWTLHICVYMCI